MAQNIVASMSATISLDKQEALSQLVAFSKEAQTYTDKHKITYKFTSDKSDLERIVKEIEGLSPELKAGVVLDFDSTEYHKQLEKLNKFIGQDAKTIGKTFETSMTKEFKNMNLQSVLNSQLGEGIESTKDNIIKIFKTLRAQTDKFDLSKVTSVDDIAQQVSALKQMSIVIAELQKQGVPKVGNIKITDTLGDKYTNQLTNIYDNAGEIIAKNASVWAANLTQIYEKEFASLQTLISNFANGVDSALGAGSGVSNLTKDIEKVKAELEEALKLQEQFGQRKPISSKQLQQSYANIATKKNGEAAFVKDFQQYVKNGAKVEALNKDIIEGYNYLSTRKDFIPIEQLKEYAQQVANADINVERLSQRLEELQQQSVTGGQGGTGGTGGIGSTSDEEVAELTRKLQEAQDKLQAVTAELEQTKHGAEDFAEHLEYANQQIAEMQQKLDAFSQGQVSIVDFEAEQAKIQKLTKDLEGLYSIISVRETQIKELSDTVESQKQELSKAEQLNAQLEENNKKLEQSRQLVKQQREEADKALKKYDAILDRVDRIDHFLDNINRYEVNGLKVATDALNKEYTPLDDERLKDKAAYYYGAYHDAGGEEPLLMNGKDVTQQILDRYTKLNTAYDNVVNNGGKQSAEQTWRQLQAVASVTNQQVMALEKQNAELRETIALLQQQEGIVESITAKENASTSTKTKKNQQSKKTKMSAEEFKKAMLKDRGGSDNTATSSGTSGVYYTDQSSAIAGESQSINAVTASVQALEQAIDRKTNAFREEEQVVAGTAQSEISNLEALDGQLFTILQTIDKIKQQMPLMLDVQMPEGLDAVQSQIAIFISDLKESLNGLDLNTLQSLASAFNTLNIKEASSTNVQRLADAVLHFKSNLDNISPSGSEFLKSIKELVAQGDSLKNLATVLTATKDQIKQAKAEIEAQNKDVNIAVGTKEWDDIYQAAKKYKKELGEIKSITYSMRQDKDGKPLKSYKVTGSKSSITLGDNLNTVAEKETKEFRKTANEIAKIKNNFIAAAQKAKFDFDDTSLKVDNQGVITFTTTVEKLGNTAEVTTYKIKNLKDALNKNQSLSKKALNQSATGTRVTKSKDKTEQSELNASIKEYKALMDEKNKLDAKNAKTRESNATYLLSQELKTVEKIAQTKAQIIQKDAQGKDTSVLYEKLALQKAYVQSVASEMQYYKGTVAYQERIAALRNKSKETSLTVKGATIDANAKKQEELDKAALKRQETLRKSKEKDTKAAETKANQLLNEELSTLDKIAQIKAEIIAKDADGKDTYALYEKLALQKKYVQSLQEEMQAYKETEAYKNRITALQNKSKETKDVVDLAQSAANRKKQVKKTDTVLARKEALRQSKEAQAEQARQEAQVLAEAEKKHAKEVADAQLKYEQDMLEQKKQADVAYIAWWQSEFSAKLESQYKELESILSKQQPLKIKDLSDDISADEQLKLNELLREEQSLRDEINLYKVLGVTNAEAELHLKEKQRALEETQFQTLVNDDAAQQKALLSVYTKLEEKLTQINNLKIKSMKSDLLPSEQSKLVTLYDEETVLLEIIDGYNKRNITDLTAANHLLEKRKTLEKDFRKAARSQYEKQYEQSHKELAKLYASSNPALERINNLEIKKVNKGLSNDEQLELNQLLEQQKKREAEIADYKKRGIRLDEEAKALLQKKLALSKDLAEATGGTVYTTKSTQKNQRDKAMDVDSTQYITGVSDKIQQAQLALEGYFKQLNDGTKRSKNDIEDLNNQFNEQLRLINELAVKDNLINDNGKLHIGTIAPGSNLEKNKNAVLQLISTYKKGEVAFETFTRGHDAMIVSIRGNDNQIKRYKASLDQTTGAVRLLYLNEKTYTSFGQKWISGLKSKIVQLTQYISGIEIIMRVWTEIQRGFEYIRELDTALTEMRKVSNETVTSLKHFQKESFNIADSVGATAVTIQNSTADWMGGTLVPLYGNI